MRIHRATVLLLLLLASTVPDKARAKIPICVIFKSQTLRNNQAYRRLVIDELRHHRTHQVVRRGCESTLEIEYIELDSGAYLTGRMGGEVPHREAVTKRSLIPARLRKLIAVLLKNDPIFLVKRRTRSGHLESRRVRNLLREGHNLYGLELFHSWVRTSQGIHALPGLAFRFKRTVEHWFLGTRVSFSIDPGTFNLPKQIAGHRIQLHGGVELESGYNIFPFANHTLYISALLGVQFMRVLGPADQANQRDELTSAIFVFGFRVGAELFRTHRFRLDLFAQLSIPFHKTRDIDSPLINDYTPSWSLGLGVAF